jgi:hypothetical protein
MLRYYVYIQNALARTLQLPTPSDRGHPAGTRRPATVLAGQGGAYDGRPAVRAARRRRRS